MIGGGEQKNSDKEGAKGLERKEEEESEDDEQRRINKNSNPTSEDETAAGEEREVGREGRKAVKRKEEDDRGLITFDDGDTITERTGERKGSNTAKRTLQGTVCSPAAVLQCCDPRSAPQCTVEKK